MQLNPLVQQREILAGTALVEMPELAVLQITGEDRLFWLHNMLSANIRNLAVGESCEALLLDPNGHIENVLHLLVAEELVWALVPVQTVDALFGWFGKVRFKSNVAWADVSAEYSVVGSWGVSGSAISKQAWQDPWPAVVAGGVRYGEVSAEPWQFFENIVCADRLAELKSSHEFASHAALDALRIAAHRPSFAEVDPKSLPHELDLLATAVHLSKGCYRGQETVAKVHNLGHPPRRLVMLHLDGSGHLLPEDGAEVQLDGVTKGLVTSVGQHFELGPIALAVVSRSVPEDAVLAVVDGERQIAASQEIVVPASAGKAVDRSKGPGGLGPIKRKLL